MNNYVSLLWRNWLRFGHFMSAWVGRALLTLFYFSIFVPFALLVRSSHDPLALKMRATSWHPRSTSDKTLKDAQRQG